MLGEINIELLRLLNSFSGFHPASDSVLFVVANSAGAILLLCIVILLLIREKGVQQFTKALAHIVIPVFIALLYTELLKELYFAPRPWVGLSDVRIVFEYGEFDSFPSGHATTYGALALSSFFYNRRIGLFFGLIALCISLSRVILGIHWPLDIVAGFAVGFSISYLYEMYLRRKVSFLNTTSG